jgi:hypothetical protein
MFNWEKLIANWEKNHKILQGETTEYQWYFRAKKNQWLPIR